MQSCRWTGILFARAGVGVTAVGGSDYLTFRFVSCTFLFMRSIVCSIEMGGQDLLILLRRPVVSCECVGFGRLLFCKDSSVLCLLCK
jgi:hypothetical protein